MYEKIYEEFISTVSHELRTPLTSIRGFAQTLLSSWDKLDEESKKKFLKIIEQQSNRLINLVENMLIVSKLEGTDNFVYKSVNASTLINPIIQLLQLQYPEHKFITEYNKNIPPILTDNDKFQQIMLNLIENAAKYSEPFTDIKIKTNFSPDANYILIQVEDNGIGIKEEDKEKIFKKFSRLDTHLTRKTQGSGLGLYITKNLTEKLDGKISFINKPKGTIFELLMPIDNIENQARKKCSQVL